LNHFSDHIAGTLIHRVAEVSGNFQVTASDTFIPSLGDIQDGLVVFTTKSKSYATKIAAVTLLELS
jgi:hypothetical protein